MKVIFVIQGEGRGHLTQALALSIRDYEDELVHGIKVVPPLPRQEAKIIIRQLWEYCQQDPFYKGNTTFLITCDHGRGESLGAHANRGEVDVPPLLCRFPARCLGSHSW